MLTSSGWCAFLTRIAEGDAGSSAASGGKAVTGCQTLLGRDGKTLLLQVGNGTLLHGIEPIHQGAVPIDRVGELVPHVVVDLYHRRSPLEVDVDLLGRVEEDLADHLIAKERLGTV